AYGLKLSVEQKVKTTDSAIKSAFLKGNTREHLLIFYDDSGMLNHFHGNELIKIKFEIDTDPPKGAFFEKKYRLLPAPYEVNIYDEASLFAGKIHAVICRKWKNRIKGRDLYDYVFYLGRETKVNMTHLRARLIESGVIRENEVCEINDIKKLLNDRFENIDYKQAKEDVIPFIKEPSKMDMWSTEFFKQITEGLTDLK
ncbi:MAG: nucleotidyl transferase AbiEii/AbiGii toxin family protein, partial [Mogibacterium diversum]|nr:nucleotidyl transferase AbiEii/AbiGii toxin family protein [Mogibacterium diversum]